MATRQWAARHWPAWMGMVFFLMTVGFASMAIVAIRRQSGVDLSWPHAVAWQGLFYGTWWPFAWLLTRIVARLGLKPILIVALNPAWAVYVGGHALFAAWIDAAEYVSGAVLGYLQYAPVQRDHAGADMTGQQHHHPAGRLALVHDGSALRIATQHGGRSQFSRDRFAARE